MSDSPPAYVSLDIHDLIATFSGLQVAAVGETTPPRRRRHQHQQSGVPTAAPIPAPVTPTPPVTPLHYPITPPQSTQRLYEIQSSTYSGTTPEWSQAAHLTQGIPNSHVRSVVSPPQKPRGKKGGIAVFFGVLPGPYPKWNGPDGAEVQVRRISGAIYQGYSTFAEAQAAFEYARGKSWTGVRDSRRLRSLPSSSSRDLIRALPVPDPRPNPLHGAEHTTVKTYHIVYAGITPGIYCSYLECSLNTVGLSGATFDSTTSLEEAHRRWRAAIDLNTIRIIPPPVYTEI
ncbi:hypothetical protein C8R43DRAFT_940752 [Mycena crocata]|nr:hypothetical protein C8R43DRAFT_940752 [Mycena crocata]